MKEQIEEMGKLCPFYEEGKCNLLEDEAAECNFDCDMCDFARTLYNAGYRKQKEGEWIIKGLANPKCSACNSYNRCGDKSDFCPNCGAHMRGGKNE